MKAFAKSILAIIFAAAFMAVITSSAEAAPAVTTWHSPTNNSFLSVNYTFVNITASENINRSWVEWGWYNASAFVNMSMSNNSLTNWYLNVTQIPNTPATAWHNFTIWMENSTGTKAVSGRYFLKIDTVTPVVDQMTSETVVSYFTNGTYENYIQLHANVSDTTSVSCGFKIFNESLTAGNSPTLTYALTGTTFTGTLTADASVRNCTYNLTASQIRALVGDNSVFIVQAYAVDNVSKTGYTAHNESFVYNYLPAVKWSMLGMVGSNTRTKDFTTDVSNGNISYISLFDNSWDAKSYATWRHGYTANNNTMDNSSWSGFFAYTSTGWGMIRKNSTTVSAITLWASPKLINQTDLNCTANTEFALTKYPVNSTYGVIAKNSTSSVSVTVNNYTTGNITVTSESGDNVTFEYKYDSARSPWNLVGMVTTNTTYGFSNQSANITYVSYLDHSTGFYQTFRKGFSFNENVTIHRGQSLWVQTGMDSDSIVITYNGTTYVNPINVSWSR
jgi:hypothetical protein